MIPIHANITLPSSGIIHTYTTRLTQKWPLESKHVHTQKHHKTKTGQVFLNNEKINNTKLKVAELSLP